MIPLLFAAALGLVPTCDLERPTGQPGCTRAAVDALPMNAIQVIGTHNSYKAAIAPAEMATFKLINPKAAASLDYAKPPLSVQLDAGARQIELDYVYDPQGGRYLSPMGLKMAKDKQAYDTSLMAAPGLKVMQSDANARLVEGPSRSHAHLGDHEPQGRPDPPARRDAVAAV
ncbi:MAG: hypothetical protein RLZZ141_345 [Pseudomonadota bacterium]